MAYWFYCLSTQKYTRLICREKKNTSHTDGILNTFRSTSTSALAFASSFAFERDFLANDKTEINQIRIITTLTSQKLLLTYRIIASDQIQNFTNSTKIKLSKHARSLLATETIVFRSDTTSLFSDYRRTRIGCIRIKSLHIIG